MSTYMLSVTGLVLNWNDTKDVIHPFPHPHFCTKSLVIDILLLPFTLMKAQYQSVVGISYSVHPRIPDSHDWKKSWWSSISNWFNDQMDSICPNLVESWMCWIMLVWRTDGTLPGTTTYCCWPNTLYISIELFCWITYTTSA